MKEIMQAIFLGLTQGLTEFLPLSSSGHLVLMRDFLGADFGSSSLFFDVMLHLGTLIALLTVFFKDFLALFRPPFKTLALLLLASIPAAIVGLLLNDFVTRLQTLQFVCFAFLFNAILLFVTEMLSSRGKDLPLLDDKNSSSGNDTANTANSINLKTAVFMGLAQAVAILPGVSRSGSTVCTGILCGKDRQQVAKFSFFMSAIVIVGSALLSGIELVSSGEGLTISVWAVVAGTFAAALSGFCAVKLMLKLIQKANYKWFSLYLLLLFIVTFIDAYVVDFI